MRLTKPIAMPSEAWHWVLPGSAQRKRCCLVGTDMTIKRSPAPEKFLGECPTEITFLAWRLDDKKKDCWDNGATWVHVVVLLGIRLTEGNLGVSVPPGSAGWAGDTALGFWGAFAKLRKATISSVMFVCPYGTTRLPTVRIFMKFYSLVDCFWNVMAHTQKPDLFPLGETDESI